MKIIAESAFNHNGDVNYLLELAKEAKEIIIEKFSNIDIVLEHYYNSSGKRYNQ